MIIGVKPVKAFPIPGDIVISPKIVTRANVRVDFMFPKYDHHELWWRWRSWWQLLSRPPGVMVRLLCIFSKECVKTPNTEKLMMRKKNYSEQTRTSHSCAIFSFFLALTDIAILWQDFTKLLMGKRGFIIAIACNSALTLTSTDCSFSWSE